MFRLKNPFNLRRPSTSPGFRPFRKRSYSLMLLRTPNSSQQIATRPKSFLFGHRSLSDIDISEDVNNCSPQHIFTPHKAASQSQAMQQILLRVLTMKRPHRIASVHGSSWNLRSNSQQQLGDRCLQDPRRTVSTFSVYGVTTHYIQNYPCRLYVCVTPSCGSMIRVGGHVDFRQLRRDVLCIGCRQFLCPGDRVFNVPVDADMHVFN